MKIFMLTFLPTVPAEVLVLAKEDGPGESSGPSLSVMSASSSCLEGTDQEGVHRSAPVTSPPPPRGADIGYSIHDTNSATLCATADLGAAAANVVNWPLPCKNIRQSPRKNRSNIAPTLRFE